MKRASVSAVAIVVLFGTLSGCNKQSDDTGAKVKYRSGDTNQPSPSATPPSDGSLTAVGFDGVEAAIAANNGKVVLIDCWATWCPPCVASFPHLVEKHQKYAGKGLAVISLSMDDEDNGEQVKAFLKRHNATFTNLHLKSDPAAGRGLKEKFAYKGGIPHAVLFDRGGTRIWAGHPMDPALESKLVAALDK
jgi:thiol-disulfide isomerase/thioredoxin